MALTATAAPATVPLTNEPLHFRTFVVNTNKFYRGLEALSDVIVIDGKPVHFVAANPTNTVWAITNFLWKVGVDLQPPKSVSWNEPTGQLRICGWTQDLDMIEAAIQLIEMAPVELRLTVSFLEVEMNEDNPNGIPIELRKLLKMEIPFREGFDAPTFRCLGILTEPQFRELQRALEKHPVKLRSGPEAITVSGRQVQIQLSNALPILPTSKIETPPPTGIVPDDNSLGFIAASNAISAGPVFDFIPYVSGDGFTIQLTVIPQVTEFVGYDDPGPGGEIDLNNRVYHKLLPLPRFRLRQIVSSSVLWDGQTLVLGNLMSTNASRFKDKVPALGDLPLVGKAFPARNKNLIIFVTPTMLDPDGKRLHSPEEMHFAQDAIPPQPAGSANPK